MKNSLIITALLLAACTQQSRYTTFTGFEQGTTYSINAKSPPDSLQADIDGVFREIDTTFSMFNPVSLTSRINRNETAEITPLFEECFVIAKQIHSLTDGYYDPTVKPLVDMWGFGPGKQQEIPCVECLLEYVGFDKITIKKTELATAEKNPVTSQIIKSDPRIQLDFSSIAKGFTVDKLAEMLDKKGVTDYLVEVGGEIRAKGVNETGRSWRIQIDKPSGGFSHEREAIVLFGGSEKNRLLASIATSGNYRNRFVDESGYMRVHTIDPKTGMPAAGEILSVSIAAESCVVADAWATGIMASQTIEHARQLLADADVEYYIIYGTSNDATEAFHSPGFPLE